uniref:Uncharacterized protein n=1 Tax=Rhizophora mucronata TaxID=61149 RepID=A0A2P2R1U0_RHIMU
MSILQRLRLLGLSSKLYIKKTSWT